jgi:UDP-N-acetylmuramyl pentapeptide phosphotransferase/UDP-N-acetylglucosamine-1-phosphate transferase
MMYILLFIALFIIQLAYFRIANYFNIIDKPNERSSHTRITLRGGGILFYVSVLIYFLFEGFPYPWFFAGLTLISAISFADDIKPRPSSVRLVIHFVSMGLMFLQWDLFSQPWYFTLIALIVCTGIMNAYNFMDGINGITGGYSLVVMSALWYFNNYDTKFVDNNLIYSIILALLVFNFFNFRPKAKCFAGDVGAVSIAFVIVYLLGLLVMATGDFSYIVMLAVYGVDSSLTIAHRLILKENIFQPHRKHAFQILANELKIPHVAVSAFYGSLQAVILIGYTVFKPVGYLYLIAVILILTVCYIFFKRKYFHLTKS